MLFPGLVTMATYVLVHGASDSWYWHRVVPQLRAMGHEVVAPDLPMGDPDAGYEDYAATVIRALPYDPKDLIVVGQSMGCYTAPMVADQVPTSLLILVAPLIPAPGESVSQWWTNTGQPEAQRELDKAEGRDPDAEFDMETTFLHDVSPEVLASVLAHGASPRNDEIFTRPWPMKAWPNVETRVLICKEDRLIPANLARQISESRLNITPAEIAGGHLVALGHPTELVHQLEAFRTEAL